MNNQEINEYLAQNLFFINDVIIMGDKVIGGKNAEHFGKSINYILNYQPVLDKLVNNSNITIHLFWNGGDALKFCVISNCDDHDDSWGAVEGCADSLGEAICRCAIEYLKIKN